MGVTVVMMTVMVVVMSFGAAGLALKGKGVHHILKVLVLGPLCPAGDDFLEDLLIDGHGLVDQAARLLEEPGHGLRVVLIDGPGAGVVIALAGCFGAASKSRRDEFLHLRAVAAGAGGRGRVELARQMAEAGVTGRAVVLVDGHGRPPCGSGL